MELRLRAPPYSCGGNPEAAAFAGLYRFGQSQAIDAWIVGFRQSWAGPELAPMPPVNARLQRAVSCPEAVDGVFRGDKIKNTSRPRQDSAHFWLFPRQQVDFDEPWKSLPPPWQSQDLTARTAR